LPPNGRRYAGRDSDSLRSLHKIHQPIELRFTRSLGVSLIVCNLPLANCIVATSVCTGGSDMPPAYRDLDYSSHRPTEGAGRDSFASVAMPQIEVRLRRAVAGGARPRRI